MNSTISIEDKKVFIRWLLKYRKMQRRECVWILNYLLSYESLIPNVHFVEDAQSTGRGMAISTTDTDDIPFRFYSGNLISTNAEKAFHDLRLNPDEKMYIQINFANKFQTQEYIAVLEDSDSIASTTNEEGVIVVSEDIERLVSEITASNGRISLLNEIDKALDNGEEELFMQLSGMLVGQEESKQLVHK